MKRTALLTLLILCTALMTRAAEPMPEPPANADKAALVAYQNALTEWGQKNVQDAEEFWKKTGDAFYKTTVELLKCNLTDKEKEEYSARMAGILGSYAMQDAVESGRLEGEKLLELQMRAATAGQKFAMDKSDVAKAEYLAYVRQLFSVTLKFALSRSGDERSELLAGLIGNAITFALAVDDYGEDAYNIVLSARAYEPELGEEAIDALCEAYEASGNPKLYVPIRKLAGTRRFAKLPGNELYFEALFPNEKGEYVKKFDPAEHEGKAYLVEVWATWCGPCRREIPRLKEVWERYHDAGFEILGYSIDQDVAALDKFVKENEIPWPVASQRRSVEAGFRGLYEYYSINGVPEMILVDRDGKVLETDCRGVKLARALAKLYPDVPPLEWKESEDFSSRAQESDAQR